MRALAMSATGFLARVGRRLILILQRCALTALLAARAEPCTVLYGAVDDEENVLSFALGWSEVYEKRIVVLVGDVDATRLRLSWMHDRMGEGELSRIEIVRRTAAAMLYFHGRSEVVLTSHVLIPGPRAWRRRLHVYLSHGIGPKLTHGEPSTAQLFMSLARAWEPAHRQGFSYKPDTPAVQGFPRLELMLAKRDHSDETALRKLGIDPSRPFVLWLPTYRRLNFSHKRSEEGVALDGGGQVAVDALQINLSAIRHGVQLVVKPHPFEFSDLERLADVALTNRQIWDAGLSPYRLVGLSDGMISDYSSAWVEYLLLNRSIGLFCPDISQFKRSGRGFKEPAMQSFASDLFINDVSSINEFFSSVGTRALFRPEALAKTCSALELRRTTAPLADGVRALVDACQAHGIRLSRGEVI